MIIILKHEKKNKNQFRTKKRLFFLFEVVRKLETIFSLHLEIAT